MKKKVFSWLILLGVSAAAGIAAMFLGFAVYMIFTGYGGVQDYDLPYFIISGTVAALGVGVIVAIKQAASEIVDNMKNNK